ncbi:hypothetical protein NL676_039192 [Syzygium grande]|nr:hypothetical protein NL676_039192 [Syzygium grande]
MRSASARRFPEAWCRVRRSRRQTSQVTRWPHGIQARCPAIPPAQEMRSSGEFHSGGARPDSRPTAGQGGLAQRQARRAAGGGRRVAAARVRGRGRTRAPRRAATAQPRPRGRAVAGRESVANRVGASCLNG